MRVFVFLLVLMPVFLFASQEAKEGTDIVYRTINFLIFAAILYYLIADKVKAFFVGRSEEIAKKLSSIQEKVKETKDLKAVAQKRYEDSQKEAGELVELAKKEANLQIEKLKSSFEDEVKILENSYEAKKEVLEKKMVSEVVDDLVEELFSKDGISLNEDELVNIINKKVA